MIDDKNIPSADQSWPAAEKMLDKHFKKRRRIIWFLSLVIPAFIVGLALMISHLKNAADKNNVSSYVKETPAVISSKNNSDFNKENKVELLVKNNNNSQASESTISNQLLASKKSGNKNSNKNIAYSNIDKRSVSKSSITASSVTAVKLNDENKINDNDAKIYSNRIGNNQEEIPLMASIYSGLSVENREHFASENAWPKKVNKSCNSGIGWEATVYGGAQYVNKTLSTSNDWGNYLMHRQNEEEPVITPTIGLSLSANHNSLNLSIGVEYSYSGEKTNYYPYSNQPTYVDYYVWQTDTIYYVHTDIAYITGNQYFINTTMMRTDTSYVHSQDTIEEYKYDERIAESNGVNRIYYIEMPVEVSYCFTRGKTGFGLSGGISPAMLVKEKGYYLRSDGKGIESLEEMDSFRKFLVNGRLSVDFYYRIGARTKFVLRPQFKANLNSVFEDSYGVKQKYYSTGVLFGVTYLIN